MHSVKVLIEKTKTGFHRFFSGHIWIQGLMNGLVLKPITLRLLAGRRLFAGEIR